MKEFCIEENCEKLTYCKDRCKRHYNALPETRALKCASRQRRRRESAEIVQRERDQCKSWREKNPERNSLRMREWRTQNKERVLAYRRQYDCERKKVDINYRLMCNLRTRLAIYFKQHDSLRQGSHIRELLGCSPEQLRAHLESLFTDGMTWETYGRKGWHIDHKEPLTAFDLTDPDQLMRACHYTNLQPMWHLENIRKGGRNRPRTVSL